MEGDTVQQRSLSQATGQQLSGSTYLSIHSPKGWAKLPIPYKFSASLTDEQKRGLISAMETWEKAVGKKLFEYSGDDSKTGDNFNDLYSSLDDRINGHYEDNDWSKTGKPENVLATAIWDNAAYDNQIIATADLRFNSQYYIIGDSFTLSATPEKEVVDMESLALHELGHLLGLSHVDAEKDPYSIMNPTLYIGEGLANRRISKGDIELIQKIYGCEGEACDIETLYTKLEQEPTSDEQQYAH